MCRDTVGKLGWVVPLKVDIEFGQNWTVKYNLTEMAYNQGGGDWNEEFARIFPDHYANYLACGGTPIDADAPPPDGPQLHPAMEPPKDSASPPPVQETPSEQPTQVARAALPAPSPSPDKVLAEQSPPEMDGDAYIFRIPGRSLTPVTAQKLARVVYNCAGRGVDDLRVEDDEGNDLIGGTIKVAYEEFRLLAGYELGG